MSAFLHPYYLELVGHGERSNENPVPRPLQQGSVTLLLQNQRGKRDTIRYSKSCWFRCMTPLSTSISSASFIALRQ